MTITGTLTYLGTKGGGLHFSESLASLCPDAKIVLSSQNQELEKFGGKVEIIQGVPSGIFENIFILKSERKKIARKIVSKIVNVGISTMQHPIDNTILELPNRIHNIISVIHDAEPHRGDIWPKKKDIEKRAKLSDSVITLSSYSARKLYEDYGVKSILMPLLGPMIEDFYKKTEKLYDIAFIGRGKKYQGANDFIRILESIPTPLKVVTNVLTKKEVMNLHQNSKHKICLLNSWVNDDHMLKNIASSKTLILPYQSASQSGWIPIARDLGLGVIATNVGGLGEQFEDGRDGILVPERNPKLFAEAIVRALKEDWPDLTDMSSARLEWKVFLESKIFSG